MIYEIMNHDHVLCTILGTIHINMSINLSYIIFGSTLK